MQIFKVNLQQYFFEEEEDEGPDNNPTLISIRNINKPTKFSFEHEDEEEDDEDDEDGENNNNNNNMNNILFQHDNKDLLRQRLRTLFHVVAENSYIKDLAINGDEFHFPGVIIAEWIKCNQYVSNLVLCLTDNQSDMPLLCDAIQHDTTIKTIRFGSLIIDDLGLLGTAIRKNKGIVNIECSCDGLDPLTVLSGALGPGNNIHSLSFDEMGSYSKYVDYDGITIDYANQIENILINSTLTSFKTFDAIDDNGNMIPILRGVKNSNTITHFYFDAGLYETIDYQNECIQLISEMDKIQYFSFHISNFSKISGKEISSTLYNMKSLNIISIECTDFDLDTSIKKLICIIQDIISTWKRQYELRLRVQCPTTDLISLFKYVNLHSLKCISLDCISFKTIIEEIPNWKYMKELDIILLSNSFDIDSNNRNNDNNNNNDLERQIQFATAVSKNSSLKKVSVHFRGTNNFLNVQLQYTVNHALERNERLDVCKNKPEIVPITEWPDLFAMADPTGIDFSYTCIRKIPNTFLSLLLRRNDDIIIIKQGSIISSSSSDDCIINNLHNVKREASSNKNNYVTVKRPRQTST